MVTRIIIKWINENCARLLTATSVSSITDMRHVCLCWFYIFPNWYQTLCVSQLFLAGWLLFNLSLKHFLQMCLLFCPSPTETLFCALLSRVSKLLRSSGWEQRQRHILIELNLIREHRKLGFTLKSDFGKGQNVIMTCYSSWRTRLLK